MMRDRKAQAEHYRNRSEEARTMAEWATNPEIRRFLLGVASDYHLLAEDLERTQVGDELPASE